MEIKNVPLRILKVLFSEPEGNFVYGETLKFITNLAKYNFAAKCGSSQFKRNNKTKDLG